MAQLDAQRMAASPHPPPKMKGHADGVHSVVLGDPRQRLVRLREFLAADTDFATADPTLPSTPTEGQDAAGGGTGSPTVSANGSNGANSVGDAKDNGYGRGGVNGQRMEKGQARYTPTHHRPDARGRGGNGNGGNGNSSGNGHGSGNSNGHANGNGIGNGGLAWVAPDRTAATATAFQLGELERLRTTNSRLEIEVHGLRVDKEMVELQAREAEADLGDAHRDLERLKGVER